MTSSDRHDNRILSLIRPGRCVRPPAVDFPVDDPVISESATAVPGEEVANEPVSPPVTPVPRSAGISSERPAIALGWGRELRVEQREDRTVLMVYHGDRCLELCIDVTADGPIARRDASLERAFQRHIAQRSALHESSDTA